MFCLFGTRSSLWSSIFLCMSFLVVLYLRFVFIRCSERCHSDCRHSVGSLCLLPLSASPVCFAIFRYGFPSLRVLRRVWLLGPFLSAYANSFLFHPFVFQSLRDTQKSGTLRMWRFHRASICRTRVVMAWMSWRCCRAAN